MLINSLLASQKQSIGFFHKTSKKATKNYNMLLKLPRLQINNYNIEIFLSIKFLGAILDENLLWKDHTKYTENKISKNIGILHKA